MKADKGREQFDRLNALDPLDGLSTALPKKARASEEERHGLARLAVMQTIVLALIITVTSVLIVGLVMRYRPASAPGGETLPLQAVIEQPAVPEPPAGLAEELAQIRAELFKWRYHVGSKLSDPFLGPEGNCYVHSFEGNVLYAVKDGELLWTYGMGPWTLHETGVMPDGTVLLRSQHLVALDAKTGRERWSYQPPKGKVLRGPFLNSHNQVVILSEASVVITREPRWERTVHASELKCFNSAGRELWDYTIPGKPTETLAMDERGTVYFSTERVAYDGEDSLSAVGSGGRKLWVWKGSGEERQIFKVLDVSPEGKLFGLRSGPSTYGCELVAFDERSGRPKWRSISTVVTQSERAGVPEGSLSLVFLPDGDPVVRCKRPESPQVDESLMALDAASGKERWHFDLADRVDDGPVVGERGHIVFATHYMLNCLDADGKMLWQNSGDSYIWKNMRFGGDGLLYARSQGSLHAFNADGSERYKLPLRGLQSEIVVDASGVIYGVDENYLVALKP